MAIMQGFPPEAADQATLANWRTRPYCAWAFHHVREIVPSAEIRNDPDTVWTLPRGEADLSGAGIEQAMAASSGDAVVVLHQGRLIDEHYANGMGPRDPHILMSVSKSMLGLVAGALIARGELAETDAVTKYTPELENTAFAGATIRDLLDMRVGVKFDEDYFATDGPIIDYRYAANWNPAPIGREPGDLRSFMSKLTERDGAHGGAFHYVSPNTDLLAWVFERASGQRYADLFSERLLAPVGAEAPGYVTVDRIGGARAAGGVCMTPRDLARIGMLMAKGGSREGREVIPEDWLDDIWSAGDEDAWREGDFFEKFDRRRMAYRSKWYLNKEEGVLHGLGIHGQYVFIDREAGLSVAWVSSRHAPSEDGAFAPVFDTVLKIREALA